MVHISYIGQVEIHVDCQANLSDWMSMADEFFGLIVSHRTPFTIKIHRLSVTNYQMRQAPGLRWLLAMIDKEVSSMVTSTCIFYSVVL